MMKRIFAAASLAAVCSTSALAGGYLTNTNQSIAFLRNPSQDAMIGISALYNNPAGVTFLDKGFHFSLGLMNVNQQRNVTSSFAPFAYGVRNAGYDNKVGKLFKGEAIAPIVPSLQASYNFNDKWAVSFDFGIVGGGGKCEFAQGLGSFESQVALLPVLGSKVGIKAYDVESYMRGRAYQFGFQLGAGYKITDNLSLYGGVRVSYSTNNYFGYLRNISVAVDGATGMLNANEYFTNLSSQAQFNAGQAALKAEQLAEAGAMDQAQEYAAMAEELKQSAITTGTLAVATQDVELNCDQVAWGLTPVIGLDWKLNEHWNFAAKYEFKTKIRLKNESANSASADNLAALNQFKHGNKVADDVPAILTLGAQYSPISSVRINAGYHYYWDKQATRYGEANKLLSGGTFEVTAGAEWDITKALTVSAGWQLTNYPNTDPVMRDISFATNSNSFGIGVKYQINKTIGVEAGYLQTFYQQYDKVSADYNGTSSIAGLAAGPEAAGALVASGALTGSDHFKRENRVIGLGVTLDF